MQKRLAVVMDPIESIKPVKDSSFAMMLAAQARDWSLFEIGLDGLFLRDGNAYAVASPIRVQDDLENWFEKQEPIALNLAELDCILMRKDPPFDAEYLYATHILERAEDAGCLVVNKPTGLRDFSEKLATARFPQCCVPSLVSRDPRLLNAFIDDQQDVIVKPLDAMGGEGVFRVRPDDANRSVILEMLTAHGSRQIMAQRFIPEISAGDKRILLIDGEPIPYALARLPAQGETRANLAAGGTGRGQALSERDAWICEQLGPTLRDNGLLFVGIDVIGDYLTEINVTSPTCIRELDEQFDLDIAGELIERIEDLLDQHD